MKHVPFASIKTKSLRPVEVRVIELLRCWVTGEVGQKQVWARLCSDMNDGRARSCLQAAEHLLQLLTRHGLQAPRFNAPNTKAFNDYETSLALFIFAATEQRREDALQHALFLIAPHSVIALMSQAEKLGLPILCADCRSRVRDGASRSPLTFQ